MFRNIAALACICVPLVASCASCKNPFEKKAPASVTFSPDGPHFYVGIEGARWGDDDPTVHAVRVDEEGVEIVGPISAIRDEDGTLPAVAVDGDSLYIVTGERVDRIEPFGDPDVADQVEVDRQPYSLLGAEMGCFVGFGGEVGWIDFTEDEPRVRGLHADPSVMKPVDFIVRAGDDRIVAVDDEVTPKYAFVLELDPVVAARHLYTSPLPSGPNESYVGVGEADGTLVIAAIFGVMNGNGNTLYRWPISERDHDGDPVGEFQDDTRPGIDPRVLAGDAMTHWTDVAVLGERIFLCAGDRGILHLPLEGGDAGLHGVQDRCIDILEDDGKLVALVATGPEVPPVDRVIAILEWKDGRIVETARHRIDVPLDSLDY